MKKIQILKQFCSWACYKVYMQLLTWYYLCHVCRFIYIERIFNYYMVMCVLRYT